MSAPTTDDTARLAAMLEAETLQRAGTITYSQARQRIRERRASPVAHLALQQTEHANRLAAALRELHSVCLAMDAEDEMKRPTEAERQAGDLFAEEHGDGAAEDSASDQHAGDFGTAADDDSAGPGTGSSDDATGADSEGGETDQAGDAAEFEAGAKAAIEKASGRRGRRTRVGME